MFIRSASAMHRCPGKRPIVPTNIQNAVVAAIPGGNIRAVHRKQADFGVLYDGWLSSPDDDPVVSALVDH
ncbi:MAG: hypothetical protein R3C99_19355 [Pirellulaceae bacterium]